MKKHYDLTLIFTLATIVLIVNNQINAQTRDEFKIDSLITVSGFVEMYYGYDFQDPKNNRRPSFLYNHTRHNELNLNLGLVKLNYSDDRVRGNVGLIVGNYVTENLSAEPLAMRNIYEANIGVKLLKKHDFWLDVGIMESNLGFESVIGPKNWLMTRSLLAENSPYYLNVAKLTYTTKNKKLMISGLFSNGWQIMIDGYPSFGHQIQWYPNKKWTVNSSSFIGRANLPSDNSYIPGVLKQRYFHNFYLKYENQKFGFIASFDFGVDQDIEKPENTQNWTAAAVVTRFGLTNKLAIAARGEFLNDPGSSVALFSNTDTSNENHPVISIGASLNLDYQIHELLLWRFECRAFSNKYPAFRYNGTPTTSNYFLGTSISLKIGEF